MKKLFFSLGLSVTILLSVAFAQERLQKAAASKTQNTTFVLGSHHAHKTADPRKTVKKQVPLRLKTAYKANHGGKAMLKLEVGDVWGDGTGYQLLLDKDCGIAEYYDPMEGLDQSVLRDLYAAAEISIPENALPLGEVVLDFESDSVLVDPGEYDAMVLNPNPDPTEEDPDGVYVYSVRNGVFEDITFAADYTYIFEVYFARSIDAVAFHTPLNLTVTYKGFYSVLGSCNADKAQVEVGVINGGFETVPEYSVYYYIADNAAGSAKAEPVKVRKTVTEPLAAGDTAIIKFDEEISVVEGGMMLVIGVDTLQGESIKKDNEIEVNLIRKPSANLVEESPLLFNLVEHDFACDNPDAWEFYEEDEEYDIPETGVAESYIMASPLISRCLELKKDDVFRLSYEHMVGFYYYGWEITSSYYVLVGNVSEPDFSEWDTLYEIHDAYIGDFEKNDIYFSVEEDGTYAIAFIEDEEEGAGMGLKNISLEVVPDYDVRINSFSGMASIMPEEHVNGNMPARIIIQNRGKQTVDAVVKITLGAEEILVTEANELKEAANDTLDVVLPLSGLKAGDNAVLTARVSIKGKEDAVPADNSLEKIIKVDDKVMAYDYTTDDMYEEDGVGLSNSSIGLGLPFTLAAQDTLTGISVGWAQWYDMPVILRIYEWNAEKGELGAMLLNETVRRGEEAAQREYPIPARLLSAGTYMISVQQTGDYFSLVCDGTKEGFLYIPTNNPVTIQYGFGTPAVRAIFGHDGKPLAKDLSVAEISKPKETGLFTNEQPIVVKVLNNGHEAVSDAPITVMVNKEPLPVQNISLPAYSEVELTFKGDLSAADAEFVLTAFSGLEGDEDVTNDTCMKTVHSMPPVNPYIMDFEYCDDFAIDDDLVSWTGVCGETEARGSYGFSGIDFPHVGEVFAFIAYNPDMSDPITESAAPHGGDRFGASFAWLVSSSISAPNNAWLISPKLSLSAANAFMTFFVKSFSSEYEEYVEEYNVLVSTTDNKLESFIKIGGTREVPAGDWMEVKVDLSEYAGKDVYLAIQCVSDDQFIFMIDDIVVGNVANENTESSVHLSAWPNPAAEAVYIRADQAIEQVVIFSPAGNRLYQSADNMNAEEFRYNVKNLTSGLYLARVKTAQGVAVVKFVVR